MAEKTISVRLAARVDSYVAAIKAAQASTTGFSRATERNLKQVGSSMQAVGRNMSTFVTLPLVAAAGLAVRAAVDWESAWAGVTKTVDGTAEQMAELEQGLRDMAKELPATHAEIAAVAEAAGALGVSTEDIEGFTRVMIDLGETTNLTADEAATSIAQLMNVMGTSGDDVDNLGSALVHLGNNGASTEDQIIQMAQRIAGAGELIGLSEADVLGFANALASMGIEVEAGGSSLSRVFADMSKAVAQGGDDLDAFSQVAGVSASEFAAAFREDPAQAVVSFIDGLGRIHAAGGDVFTVLDQLGLSDIRVSRALLSMATSGDLLSESLQMSGEAWAENTALADEAAKRYETAGARFEMVRNKVVDLFIDLGTMLLPVVEKVVDAIGFLAEAFQNLPAPVQMAVGGFLGLLAAMGPITFIAGGIVKNFSQLRGAVSLLGGALTGSSGQISKTAGALGILGVAVAAGGALWSIHAGENARAKEKIDAAAAALQAQTEEAWRNAEATLAAGDAVDGLALANDVLVGTFESVINSDEELNDSIARLNITSEEALDIITRLGSDTPGALRQIADAFGLNEEHANRWVEAMSSWDPSDGIAKVYELSNSIGIAEFAANDLADAFVQLHQETQNPALAEATKQFLDGQARASDFGLELVRLAEANARVGRDTNPIAVFQEWNKLMGEADPATQAVAVVLAALTGAAEGTVPPVEAAGAAMGETGDAAGDMAEKVDASSIVVQSAAERMEEAAEGFQDAWVSAIDEMLSSGMGLYDAEQQLWEVAQGFSEAIDESSRSLELNTEEGRANADAVQEWAQAVADHTQEMIDSGANAVDVANDYAHNRDALLDNAEAMGFNRQEVESLLREWGLMPNLVSTTYQMAGIETAKTQVETMIAQLGEIPEEEATEIQALLDDGLYDEAIAMLFALANPITVPVDVRVRSVPRIGVSNGQVTYQYGPGAMRAMADGGFLNRPETILAGEDGREAVVPLTKPDRMKSMLADPMSAPIWSAMASMMGGASAKAGDTKTVYVTVNNNGREVTVQDISRALREAL